MKVKSLEVDNFLSIKQARVDFVTGKVIMVSGVNKDDASAVSNGAGKSAIVDALCWSLYGITARGIRGGDVVRRGETICKVGVVFNNSETDYIITRYGGKENALCLWRCDDKGFQENISKGTQALTQYLINDILGCNYQLFKSVIYMGQDQLPDFPSLTDKGLKVFLEQVLDMSWVGAASLNTKEKYEHAKNWAEQVRQKLEDATNQLNTTKADLMSVEAESAQWDDQQQERVVEAVTTLKQIKTNIDEQQTNIAELYKEFDRLIVEKKNAVKAIQERIRVIKTLTDRVKQLANDCEVLNNKRHNLDQQQIVCPVCATMIYPIKDNELAAIEEKRQQLKEQHVMAEKDLAHMLDGHTIEEHYANCDARIEELKTLENEHHHFDSALRRLKASKEQFELQKKTQSPLENNQTPSWDKYRDYEADLRYTPTNWAIWKIN